MTAAGRRELDLDALTSRATSIDPRRLALLAGAGIAVLAVLGALVAGGVLDTDIVDLDGEYAAPAAWSGLLLLAGAGVTLLAARLLDGADRALVGIYALLLLLMGLDETLMLHERIEAWSGVRWQYLYAPVVAIAGVGWLRAAGLGRRVGGWGLLVAGVLAWAVSQGLELLQWSGEELTNAEYEARLQEASYLWLMVPEETLEMIGSLLLLLGGLALLRGIAATTGSGGHDTSRRRAPAA